EDAQHERTSPTLDRRRPRRATGRACAADAPRALHPRADGSDHAGPHRAHARAAASGEVEPAGDRREPRRRGRRHRARCPGEGGNANYGSPGNGTHHHLIMESLKLRTGLQLTHIPYKGSAPAFTDLMGGQIATMFVPMGTALSLGGAGKIRVVGGSARERSPLAPHIPSLHEQGVKDFDYSSWFSAWGPAGMAPDLVARYN